MLKIAADIFKKKFLPSYVLLVLKNKITKRKITLNYH